MRLTQQITIPPQTPPNDGGHKCPVCGELHASDDTEIWCATQQEAKQ